MTEDLRLVAAGAALLLSSSVLFLPTAVPGDISLLLAVVAVVAVVAAALRFGVRRTA